jgi:xanthine dehydrogenase small subunit
MPHLLADRVASLGRYRSFSLGFAPGAQTRFGRTIPQAAHLSLALSVTVAFCVNGAEVEVPDDGASLLEALRDRLGLKAAKDGCSPQGQCGCCTVLVDGQPRVACVTPVVRVRGREITTLEGMPEAETWAEALWATGGSQCGFCTPGIIVRLAARPTDPKQALLAHLCRCTGWQTIVEAAKLVANGTIPTADRSGADARATLEGHTHQTVSPAIALGQGGFADDTAPPDALIAVRAADGAWMVGETLTAARKMAGKVQGRRTTVAVGWPIELPDGDWLRTLQTTWVEPAYLEPDASWCAPGGEPASALANGGAFGGKLHTEAGDVARRLAIEYGRAVKVVYSREDVVNLGPKRPPIAAGIRADGSGIIRVARTPGIVEAITSIAPGLTVEEIDIIGPPTSTDGRAAGWAEGAALVASLADIDEVVSSDGARASAVINDDGSVSVKVNAGEVLDEVTLRSYCIGAAHQALGWVRTEAIAVDDFGQAHDLTIRSFGILRAVDMPYVEVVIEPDNRPAVNGSDAVFAAVAAAAWRRTGWSPAWPTQR